MVKIKCWQDDLSEHNICTPHAVLNCESKVLAYRPSSDSPFNHLFNIKMIEIKDDFE